MTNDKLIAEATVEELIDELVGRSQSIVLALAWKAPDEIGSSKIYRQRVVDGVGLECVGLVHLLDKYALDLYFKDK